VATIHAPGTGVGPHGGRPGRRATIVAAVVLAFAAIVVPFGLRDVGKSGAQASPATHATASPPSTTAHRSPVVDAAVGPRGDLPALLPARSARLSDGLRVRLGVITDGVLRRTPAGTWQVLVRWNGRLQPVPTHGPVRLAGGPAGHAPASWVSDEGLLYTRVAMARPDRFRVFAWEPRGATAYTPPTLVAKNLGLVCFNRSFTAFGDCGSAG
jgi:hypothetical protein